MSDTLLTVTPKIARVLQDAANDCLAELAVIESAQLRLEAARLTLQEEYQSLLAMLLKIRDVSKDPSPQSYHSSVNRSECKKRLSETSHEHQHSEPTLGELVVSTWDPPM